MTQPEIRRLRSDAESIFAAALRAVDPFPLVQDALEVRGRSLFVDLGKRRARVAREPVFLAGAGKAVERMAAGAAQVLPAARGLFLRPAVAPVEGPARRTGSPVLEPLPPLPAGFPAEFRDAEHPVPGRGSFAGTAELLRSLATLPRDATVLFLLSGGASALLEAPAPGISRAQLQGFTRRMLRCGAPIELLNAARVRLSAVKGGGLASVVAPRRLLTLAVSDVPTIGDDPRVIGSGPTLRPPGHLVRRDLLAEIEELPGMRRLSEPLRSRLGPGPGGGPLRGPGPGDFGILADNGRARRAAGRAARQRGYRPRALGTPLAGEASEAARAFVERLASLPPAISCCIQGGETTVSAGASSGRGGRNQEFALAAAERLDGSQWVLLAAGTDGIDGPTDAAGGLVDPFSLAKIGRRACAKGLAEHDSWHALARGGKGMLLRTGPTGSNVGDLVIALRRPIK